MDHRCAAWRLLYPASLPASAIVLPLVTCRRSVFRLLDVAGPSSVFALPSPLRLVASRLLFIVHCFPASSALEANRPDLTMEAIIQRPKFRSLFSAEELRTARD